MLQHTMFSLSPPSGHRSGSKLLCFQEKQLIADEAAWWAKAASVYPGQHGTSCSPQLQQYRDLYSEFGGGKGEKPTKKLIQVCTL